MSAAKVWWFRARLCAAFPLLCLAAIIIDCQHLGDMARCVREMWEDGEPKRWYYAIPIVVFWGIIIWVVVRAIWL